MNPQFFSVNPKERFLCKNCFEVKGGFLCTKGSWWHYDKSAFIAPFESKSKILGVTTV